MNLRQNECSNTKTVLFFLLKNYLYIIETTQIDGVIINGYTAHKHILSFEKNIFISFIHVDHVAVFCFGFVFVFCSQQNVLCC